MNFALIGAAGYIAPRHFQAIKAVGGVLSAAFDPNDSVGVIDRYFPDASFFVEFEQFDHHVDKLRRTGGKINFISVCSPNYLHDAHCRFALRSAADAICEKPTSLNPSDLDGLSKIEAETGHRINTILQLRMHPAILALKARVDASDRIFNVDLSYIAPRGSWYHASWKGDEVKSGGVATNIGVHFIDALIYLFGPASTNIAHLRDTRRAAGFLVCSRANIRWFVSVDRSDLPSSAAANATYRSMIVDGEEIEFSEGFADLHAHCYQEIVAGRGFDLNSVRPSIEIVASFRGAPIELRRGERHPLVQRCEPAMPLRLVPAAMGPDNRKSGLTAAS